MVNKFKEEAELEEKIVRIPIPPLVTILIHKEQEKGSMLTQKEVENIRDGVICMTMSESVAKKMEEARGYPDISPDRVWDEWTVLRLKNMPR